MKHLSKLFFLAIVIVMSSCSEYVIVPQYVSVEKLNALKSGMSKDQVSNNLSVEPYDAYHSTENGCELYSFKYLHKYQEINPKNKTQKGALRNNVIVYADENDAFLYFEDGLLKNLIISGGKADNDFVSELITACNGPVSGCDDDTALNFNENAIINDGSCKYCPCDYIKNPNYNSNNTCEEECMPTTSDEAVAADDDCSLCDIIKESDGNVTINVSASENFGSTVQNSPNNSVNNSQSTGKLTKNGKGDEKKNKKLEDKLEKLRSELDKSKKADSKKGVKSKKTELLEISIDKLTSKL